jgi:hypothetical protein
MKKMKVKVDVEFEIENTDYLSYDTLERRISMHIAWSLFFNSKLESTMGAKISGNPVIEVRTDELNN